MQHSAPPAQYSAPPAQPTAAGYGTGYAQAPAPGYGHTAPAGYAPAAAPAYGNGYAPGPAAAFTHRPVQAMGSFLNSLSSPAALARYWRAPLMAAAGAFGAAMLLSILIYGTVYAIAVAGQPTAPAFANPIQLVLIQFFQFHRVALSIDALGSDSMSATFVFAPLGGLLLVGILLAIAGGFAGSGEPTFSARGLAVIRYAAAYAVLCFFASFFVATELPGTESAGRLSASPAGAFFMGLLLATFFGLVGAAVKTYGRRWVRPAGMAIERRVRGAGGAFVGAVSGLRTGLGLALLGMIVVFGIAFVVNVASAAPSADTTTGDTSSSMGDDELRVLLLGLLMVLLVLPNVVIAALLGGMGATLNATGAAQYGPSFSGSVGIFGASGTGSDAIDVPPYFLLLLLVPAVATVRAGYVAARETAPGTGPAMRAALGAGGLMTVGCWVLTWFSGGEASTPVGALTISVSPTAAMFLPPVWALVGAWLGALLFLARQQQLQQRPAQVGAYAVPNGSYPTATGQFATPTPWTAATPPPYGQPNAQPTNTWPASAPPAHYAPASAPPAHLAPASAPPAPYGQPVHQAPAHQAAVHQAPAHQAAVHQAPAPPADGSTRPCAHCGTPNHPTNNFCEACGQHVASAA